MRKIVLPEFQDYLRSKSLVNEKYIPFYAHWARKFLSFSDNSKHLGHDLRIEAFLNHLRSQDNIADWQIHQSEDAVKLYVNQFPDSSESPCQPTHFQKPENLFVSSEIIEKMQ
ncbi:MAG: hypothetical protein KAJ10_03330 [Thermodesulfovibrionia bacterium]|nr:hypothetical protein [Thermodesulfovibrionia bacterium]